MLELGLWLLSHPVSFVERVPRDVGAAVVQRSDEEQLVLRRYDLSHLRSHSSWGADHWRVVLAPRSTETSSEHSVAPEWVDIEEVLQSILDSLSSDEFDGAGRFAQPLDATSVIVSASAQYHADFALQLSHFDAANRADARVIVERLRVAELPRGFTGGIFALETAQQMMQSLTGESHSKEALIASPFQPSALARSGSTRLLVDQNGEIASGAQASEPLFVDVPIGPRGSLRMCPGGGGWHVRFDLGESQVEELESPTTLVTRAETPSKGVVPVGYFTARSALISHHVASELFLPDGSAAVFVRPAAGGGMEVALVHAVGGDSAITRALTGETRAVHLGPALQPRLRSARLDDFGEHTPWSGWFVPRTKFREGVSLALDHTGLEVDSVMELLAATDTNGELAGALWTLGSSVTQSGPLHGQIVVDEAAMEGHPGLLQRLEGVVLALAPTRRTLVARGRLMGGGVETARFEIPLAADGNALVSATRETPRVTGATVQVAENASMGEPIVQIVIDGYAIALRVADLGGAGLEIAVDGAWQSSSVSVVETGSPLAPQAERVELRVVELRGSTRLPAGGGTARFGELNDGGVWLELTLDDGR